MAEKQDLVMTIDNLISEKEGLIFKIRNLTRLAERQELSISEKSRSYTPQREKRDTDIVTEFKGAEPNGRSRVYAGRSPVTVDLAVDYQPNVIKLAVEQNGQPIASWKKRLSRQTPREGGSQVEKENQMHNYDTEERRLPPLIKKFIGAWTQVAELLESFDKLHASLMKLSTQISKDKTRIEQLSIKKVDLAPYVKDISAILAGLQSEALATNKEALESSEADYLGRSIGFFEKLAEEYSYIYGSFSEKLKSKKADYIRWNKKLATYCQNAYPGYMNF